MPIKSRENMILDFCHYKVINDSTSSLYYAEIKSGDRQAPHLRCNTGFQFGLNPMSYKYIENCKLYTFRGV